MIKTTMIIVHTDQKGTEYTEVVIMRLLQRTG